MTLKSLTLTGVSEYLGIPRRTLYNQINDGRFPVEPIPGTRPRRWSVDALNKSFGGGA
jgi:predicted DNA-binding transcriptional regulator AlpA